MGPYLINWFWITESILNTLSKGCLCVKALVTYFHEKHFTQKPLVEIVEGVNNSQAHFFILRIALLSKG